MSTRKAFADASSGVAGSLVAMLTFYPIDVVKTNMQAGNGNEGEGSDKISMKKNRRKPDLSTTKLIIKLFRGLHLKAAHTCTSSFAYFFIYSWIQAKHKGNKSKYQPSTASRLLLAAIAGCVNVVLTLPLDVLAARSQTRVNNDENEYYSEETDEDSDLRNNEDVDTIVTADAQTSRTLSKRGIKEDCTNVIMDEIWKNVNDMEETSSGSDDGQNTNTDGYDTAYEDVHEECDAVTSIAGVVKYLDDEPKEENNNFVKYTCCSSTFSSNVSEEALKGGIDDKYSSYPKPLFKLDSFEEPRPNLLSYVLCVLRHKSNRNKLYNVSELWRGLGPSLLLCTNPSINFTVFDTLKDIVLMQKEKRNQPEILSMGEAFVLGILAKFAATMATYPLIRAKIILMVKSKKGEQDESCNSEDDSTIGVLRSLYARGGREELYKGCSLQLLHTLLKSALMMMVRETVTANTRRMF